METKCVCCVQHNENPAPRGNTNILLYNNDIKKQREENWKKDKWLKGDVCNLWQQMKLLSVNIKTDKNTDLKIKGMSLVWDGEVFEMCLRTEIWCAYGNTPPPPPKSISQTQPLDMTLSTCTQLIWSTMASPVLSGTCPVKSLYGLAHRAAAQHAWQSSYSLRQLYVEQQIFFSDPQRVLCHVKLPVTSMREWERSHKMGPIRTFSPKGVLTFVASGLELMAMCWVILRGQQIYTVKQDVHLLLDVVAKCHFFALLFSSTFL